MRNALALACMLGLVGCASLQAPALGTLYKDTSHASQQPGTTWVTIFRPGKDFAYSGQHAVIAIDGTSLGSVDFQGFESFDLPSGSHELSVEFNAKCTIDVDLPEGKHVFYEVDNRSSAVSASLVGGSLGALVESAGKKCGGAFSLQPIDEATALARLSGLRETKRG
jgi:hypothetical protein